MGTLLKRALVALILLPPSLLAIYFGGWFYALIILALTGLAAWEYIKLMQKAGFKPFVLLVVGGVLLLIIQRQLEAFDNAPITITLLTLASMTYHIAAYERGRDQAASDLGATLLGIIYLGWIGAYFISLRSLPDGRWWTYLVLPSVWGADSLAYFIGKRWGRHALCPRLSPKKTWEGYFGSIAGGIVFGTGLGWIFSLLGSGIQPLAGFWIGLLMGTMPTLGDLGASMIKRSAGAKDSGSMLPGHGGFFDRIDSLLWASVLGFYLIQWFWI